MKQKTHKGTNKRMKVSATGKIKSRKCGARHLKSKMAGKKKRGLRGTAVIAGKKAKQIRESIS